MGLLICGWLSYSQLQRNARDEVLHDANMLMETALAVRAYTNVQIKPHLDPRLETEFLPQTVPAFAATEAINELRKKYPEYHYKEAALNPTNPRDRAMDWEADIVNGFRESPDQELAVGKRGTGDGYSLYIARPIKITNPACLTCHSTPSAAPPSMLRIYGEANGFGWKNNEIIGAQIVSVPANVPMQKARSAFWTVLISLVSVFSLIFVVLQFMLTQFILKPLERMRSSASEISTGNLDVPELDETKQDEIGALAVAFNRMMRSLKRAMQMLDQ
jgi:protein-histidine pros-kinase